MLPDPRTNFHEINRRMASDQALLPPAASPGAATPTRQPARSILRVAFRRLGRWSHLRPSTNPARPLA